MTGTIQPGGLLMPGAARPKHHPMANLFPMLSDDRRPSFRASLNEKQNHPITLHRGMILDGRNRERELGELNKPVAYVVFVGTDRDALDFVIAENLERRDLTDKQRAMIAAKIATLKLGDNQHTRTLTPIGGPSLDFGEGDLAATEEPEPPAASLSIGEASKVMNAPRRSVERAAVIEANATEELKEAVSSGPISLDTGATLAQLPAEEQRQVVQMSKSEILEEAKRIRKEANDKRRTERADRIRKISDASAELPTGRKFPLLYFDPATEYEAGDSDRSTENHYPTMTEEEIAALPIAELATDDAVLLMWSTVAWLRKSLRMIEGWGFEYKSCAFWDKVNIGLGFWWRDQVEILIVATRGKPPAPANGSVLGPSLYSEKKGRHSAKPIYFRERIDAVPEWKDWPKVELFARIDGPMPEGWFAWGNQARVPEQQSLGIDTTATSEAAE